MSIELKGQDAIDAACDAMRNKVEIELFGLRYKVSAVRTETLNFSDAVKGSVDLMCTTRHAELKSK